ncbi:alpha/beta fold hydrolase [Arthrobacter sp. CAU 1506]|uniref:alpha/beta fold hydrolase n=1 Tax=Arthrobacter sp. CAU 1506 TaxID=2560052 RepID=UPI0010ABDE2D|nr:alpha/beta fold hydrolase [Arthrobacter sp. CAU 1506]TJY68820.1 alpha/beta fold hydrolase [Arthrobacter sp. CAU 1506]
MVAKPLWPGVDPAWSRRVRVPSTAAVDPAGTAITWHLLDNGPQLAERGIEPVGTLLCVHGNPTWSYLWRTLLAAAGDAAAPWRVVAVDQLDMGFSERTGRFRRLEDRITDLGDLTAELGITGPVVTVGHDWGGVISLGWATRHRKQLSGVVLTNTAVHPAGFGLPAPLKLALHPAVHQWGTTTSAAFLRVTHALAHPPLEKDVKDAFMAPYRHAARRTGVGNFVADIPADEGTPSWGTLIEVAEGIRTLDVPALIMWGPKDPVFSDRYLRDLMDRLPQADVHRFEGAGHLLPEDRDIATPLFTWLSTPVADQATAPGDRPKAAPVVDQASASERVETQVDPAPGDRPKAARPARRSVGTHAQAFRPMLAELDERRTDDSPAVVDMAPLAAPGAGPRTLTWAELAGQVDLLADGLAGIGVKAGDRINLLVPPGIELTSLIYACLKLGAVIVVADAGLGPAGLSRAIKGAGPKFIVGIERAFVAARLFNWPGQRISVTDLGEAKRKLYRIAHTVPELVEAAAANSAPPLDRSLLGAGAPPSTTDVSAPVVDQASASERVETRVETHPETFVETSGPGPDPDDDAAILFTSGSTGPAKGVVYTHRQLAAMRDTLKDTYGLEAGTSLVAGFAPFALLGPALGATSVTPDMDVTAPKTLTAAALADAAAAVHATAVFASPAALTNVLATADGLTDEHRVALSSVKLLLSAGAPIPEPLLAKVQSLVPSATLHTPYGMTEALPVTDISLDGIRAAGSGNGVCVGTPVSGATVAIAPVAADGSVSDQPTTNPGVTGEILVSAPHVKDRYDGLWITQQHSASVPGWHRTGDVGHLDAEGRLWVEGRLAHIITTASGVATPVAAEQAAETHDVVRLAAVVGVGPVGAQVPVAVLETLAPAARPGTAPRALGEEVRAAVVRSTGLDLAAVLVVPELPTDIRHNSKIDRAGLADWATRSLAGGRIRKP